MLFGVPRTVNGTVQCISVTLDTSQLLSGWLKELAWLNIPAICDGLDTFQLLSGWLKDSAPQNIRDIVSTLDTFHLLSGWLKVAPIVGGSFAARWARMVLKRCSSERGEREKRFYGDGKDERRRTAF